MSPVGGHVTRPVPVRAGLLSMSLNAAQIKDNSFVVFYQGKNFAKA